ncbi:hypothetical protein T4B_15473 [Trichinella pseudospiralis]|uniref:Uncharacterized protein n=1 Tax=Trichinella pseudospiralis TaxID=6337 RepID=A0A0V1GN28_TRIPS|nr:hypothetical protein T4B_15473 [Trichinella pseudospiralis]KRY99219.1 hypothetical protein T4C_3961 [Trichinella pseudospiralis]
MRNYMGTSINLFPPLLTAYFFRYMKENDTESLIFFDKMEDLFK